MIGYHGGQEHRCLPKAATALTLSTMVAALLGACAPAGKTPMNEPKEVMTVAWGPFARQCASTRTSHYVMTDRSGPKEIATDHESCIGFAAMPAPMALCRSRPAWPLMDNHPFRSSIAFCARRAA
jgi:hypothetical protein